MSITVSNCHTICNSPLNTSKSKQLFSFPKSSRFAGFPPKHNCQQAFYDLPAVKMKRSAGFGYGGKFDFTKTALKTPAPDTYNIQSIFTNTGGKVKGSSIGVGRENMKTQGIFYRDAKISVGPGSYDIKPSLSTVKFSMRPKTNLNLTPNGKFPGPGTYDVLPGISKDGRYPLSKFKASGASNFNPPSSGRFFELNKKKLFPGPGTYNPKTEIDVSGRYFVSTFHNSKCRTFSHGSRGSLIQKTDTPGPGNYRLPSEFGYYEAASHSRERSVQSTDQPLKTTP